MFSKFISRQDRRRRKRQLLNTSVRVITKLGPIEAVGINISDGGMGLFTLAHLDLGSRIDVEFRSPESSAAFTRLRAFVRHRALYLYGIEFQGDDDGSARAAEEHEKTIVIPNSHASS